MKLRGIDEMKLSTDRIRRVFILTFIFGILAHGSMLTNTILWHDGLHFAHRVKGGSAIALGRWMRAILAYAVSKAFGGNNLGMPLLYGLVSIFLSPLRRSSSFGSSTSKTDSCRPPYAG